MYLKLRKYCNFGRKNPRRAWHVIPAQEVNRWLRTITSDQTVNNNSSLSFWTRRWKLLRSNKFIICFASFLLLINILIELRKYYSLGTKNSRRVKNQPDDKFDSIYKWNNDVPRRWISRAELLAGKEGKVGRISERSTGEEFQIPSRESKYICLATMEDTDVRVCVCLAGVCRGWPPVARRGAVCPCG